MDVPPGPSGPPAFPLRPPRTIWALWALVLAISLLVSGALALALPVLDRDEARFAQASVQMLESGDYVRIRFQDAPRNKKPALIHWLQAGSVALFSDPGARAIWAFRLPSVIAAALVALVAGIAAARLYGPLAGAASGLMLAVAIGLRAEGAIAKTDAALAAASAFALLALIQLYTKPEAKMPARFCPSALLFWAAIGVGIMVKGPIILLVAGLGTLAFLGFERWRGGSILFARSLAHWTGPALALAIAAPWYIAITAATGGEFLREALGSDLAPKLAGGSESHGAPPGTHLVATLLLIAPASLTLLVGLRLAGGEFWRGLNRRLAPPAGTSGTGTDVAARAALPLIWLLPAFAVFELVPTKLVHYTLPLYPALAMLAGAGFAALFAEGAASRHRFPVIGFLLLGTGAGIGLFAALELGPLVLGGLASEGTKALDFSLARLWPLAVLGALMGGLAFAIIRRLARLALGILVTIGALVSVTFALEARRLAPLVPSAALSDALVASGLHPRLSQGGHAPPLLAIGFYEPSLVFLTRTDTRLITLAELPAMARPGVVLVVDVLRVPETEIDAVLAARGLLWARSPGAVPGFNYSKGRKVLLVHGLIRAAHSEQDGRG